jgi:predicted enzyme related to lactoylglutathione lyase
MAEFTKHEPGTICWLDLHTTDTAGAKAFYGALFGWNADDVQADGQVIYGLFKKTGKDVAGLGQLMPEQQAQGVPPHWMTYVAVESAKDAVAKAAQLGATVIMPDFDVMEHGRMAIVQDPDGAVFSVWEAKAHPGCGVRDEENTLTWSEVATRQPDKVGAFYTKLFNWKTETMPMPNGEYTMFAAGAGPMAGMWTIAPEMGPIPAHWMPYFQVADVDAAFAKATSLGAQPLMPPTDIPNDIGRFATLHDPQGAVFSIYKSKR